MQSSNGNVVQSHLFIYYLTSHKVFLTQNISELQYSALPLTCCVREEHAVKLGIKFSGYM